MDLEGLMNQDKTGYPYKEERERRRGRGGDGEVHG